MKLTKFTSYFTSNNGIQYQIEFRIPDIETTADYEVYKVSDGTYNQIELNSSIIDITDFNWEFEESPAETYKSISCKVKFNYKLLPATLANAFEDYIHTYTFSLNGFEITYKIPPSYLYIRKLIEETYTYNDDDGNPETFTTYTYRTLAVLCQQAQSELSYKKGQEYELEFIELGKHILENTLMSSVDSYINANYGNDFRSFETFRDIQNNTNVFKYIARDTNNSLFYFLPIRLLHSTINYLFKQQSLFHFGLAPDVDDTPTFYTNLIARKQADTHRLGSVLNENELYFLAYIKVGDDFIGGRLYKNYDNGFAKSEKNAYNYLKKLATMTRSKFLIELNETACGIYIQKFYTTNTRKLEIDNNLITDFEYIKKMGGRYKISASNLDNGEFDIEDRVIGDDLSDNTQSLEVPLLWNSRPHTNEIIDNKDAMGGIFHSPYSDNSAQRYSDLYYMESINNSLTAIRVHEYLTLDMGAWNYINVITGKPEIADAKISPPDQFDIDINNIAYDGAYIVIQKNGYCLDYCASVAGEFSIPVRYFKMTTLCNAIPGTFYIEKPISTCFDYDINFSNYLEFPTDFTNMYTHLMGVNIKSLKSDEIELTFAG